jgi:hypothetical protein
LLRLPPGLGDLEIGWQLHQLVWGCGYASETTRVLANWAFSHDVAEIFAVVRPGNTRAASTVRRNGMEWVGETGKYFGLDLQVFRLRRADFDPTAPATPLPPTPPPSDRSDPAITNHSRRVGWPSRSGGRAGFAARSKRATVEYRCGMVLGKNKRTPPRCAWGDVRTAQVIGLPGVQNAPCCPVSASAHDDRVLTQTRGA